MDEHVVKYWCDHYADEHCTLCGNSGIIDTRGTRTAAGIEVGRLNFCICPNGQMLRERGFSVENSYAIVRKY